MIESKYSYEKIEEELYRNPSLKNYLDEINQYKLLTQEEETTLFNKINEGDISAKQLIINSNLRLVVGIAKMYVGRGLEMLDLIQEGNIGLIKSIDKFDINRGYKFSTYATYHIKRAITYAISCKGRHIRLPDKMHDLLKKCKKIEVILEKKLCRKPTLEEIALKANLKVNEVEKIYSYSFDAISINTPIDSDEKNTLEDILCNKKDEIEQKIINKEMKEKINYIILNSNLTKEQIEFLRLRYGLEKTKKEISIMYDMPYKRVDNRITSSLKKIRKNKEINEISFY